MSIKAKRDYPAGKAGRRSAIVFPWEIPDLLLGSYLERHLHSAAPDVQLGVRSTQSLNLTLPVAENALQTPMVGTGPSSPHPL